MPHRASLVVIRFALLFVAGLIAAPTLLRADEPARLPGPLADYVQAADSSYQWTVRREGTLGTSSYVELTLTSQTWQEITWKHQLFIIKPARLAEPSPRAILFISGGSWREELEQRAEDAPLPREAGLFSALAEQIQSPIAILLHVPHQPILGGRREDQIIAFTFQRYLETNDPTWPLLLPMVKSAVRAMDAVQEVAQQKWSLEIPSFTISGASKRGWTTWLTGAVDPRATAIAPMVIDMLNMGPQMRHQRKVWGDFSHEISDYTELRLQDRLDTPGGRQLASIVDPYAYREQLTQPKLIILGTNDAYWPIDALNLYWQDLVGPKYILYVPNNGHGLRDYGRLTGSLAALHEAASGRRTFPKLEWHFERSEDRLALTVESDQSPQTVQVWRASSPTQDFRQATWTAERMQRDGNQFRYELTIPDEGYTAVLGEAVYNGGTLPLYLSTNVQVVRKAEE